jgi:hypothetical protein
MGISMNFVAARSQRRADRADKLSFGHAGATIHKSEQTCTSAGIRALVCNSLYCDQAQRSRIVVPVPARLDNVEEGASRLRSVAQGEAASVHLAGSAHNYLITSAVRPEQL